MSTVQEANTWAKLLERLSADRAALVEDFLARLTSTHLYDGYNLAQEDLRRANTIVNRLLRFHDLTGLDVTIPVDAARALIAIGSPLPAADRSS